MNYVKYFFILFSMPLTALAQGEFVPIAEAVCNGEALRHTEMKALIDDLRTVELGKNNSYVAINRDESFVALGIKYRAWTARLSDMGSYIWGAPPQDQTEYVETREVARTSHFAIRDPLQKRYTYAPVSEEMTEKQKRMIVNEVSPSALADTLEKILNLAAASGAQCIDVYGLSAAYTRCHGHIMLLRDIENLVTLGPRRITERMLGPPECSVPVQVTTNWGEGYLPGPATRVIGATHLPSGDCYNTNRTRVGSCGNSNFQGDQVLSEKALTDRERLRRRNKLNGEYNIFQEIFGFN